MSKHDSTRIKQFAHARGFSVRQQQKRFILSGPADFGPASYEEARDFLANYPTSRKRKALVKLDAFELTPNEIQSRRRRRGYDAPLYEPELGELPPPDLMGLHAITVLLPPGSDGDDALRGLWAAEDRERKRGAQAVKDKIGEAQAMLASEDLEPVAIVCSDHDLASAQASGAEISVVLLAAYLMGRRFVRVGNGPQRLRTRVDVLAEMAAR